MLDQRGRGFSTKLKAGRGLAREQGKRMKWMSSGLVQKALAVTMASGIIGITACSRDYTLAYLYVTSATKTTSGVVNAYAVDYQSGALQQLPDSPVPSGGSNPVTLVASPGGKFLYVLNHDTSSVVQFDIGTDGKLYAENTTPVVQGSGKIGTFPTAAAIDAKGTFLYVTFTYQNGFTTATPGPGGLAVFPINTDGSLGTALTNTTVGTTAANPLPYYPLGFAPVGVATTAYNSQVYVVEQDTTITNGVSSQTGTVIGFTEGSTGALTPIAGTVAINGSTLTGTRAGTKPAAIAIDPSARFMYVTDELTNQLYAYGITTGGALTSIQSSPFSTGNFPLGITVDPRGSFVYVVNYNDATISGYAINTATGALSGVAGSTGAATFTGPTCITIEPALGIYMYTSNNIDSSVSAVQLSPNTGAIKTVQGNPYTAQALPTCAVAVANGAHSTQLVTP
jgi:6-phosphogluconolactonase